MAAPSAVSYTFEALISTPNPGGGRPVDTSFRGNSTTSAERLVATSRVEGHNGV